MATSVQKPPHDLQKIVAVLSEKFPIKSITLYRYNSASIRIRIIDKRFLGKSIVEREGLALPLIRRLPEDIQAQITVLLLLAPSETSGSFMNAEFEDPTPSQL